MMRFRILHVHQRGGKRLRALSIVATIAVLLAFTSGRGYAQFSGSAEGVVLDPTGEVIPNATVTLVNTNTDVKLVTVSSSSGVYRFESLAPSDYTVSANANGFLTATVSFTLTT